MDNKKLILVYDIKSIPSDLRLDDLYSIMINSGIVVYDSSLGGVPPDIIDNEQLKILDVKFLSAKEFSEKFENLKD